MALWGWLRFCDVAEYQCNMETENLETEVFVHCSLRHGVPLLNLVF